WAVDLSKEALELAWQASDKQRVEHYKKKTADLYLETLDFRIENGVYTYVRKAFSKGLNFCEKEDLTSEALGFFNKFIDFCGEEFKQYKDKSSETQFINAGLEAARFCVSNNLVGKVVGYYLGALEHIDKEVTGIYAYDVAAKAAIEAARTFRNKEEFGGIVDHFYNLGIKLLEKNGSFETCLKIAQEFNDTPRINLFTALIS
ncbi:hypothetical protein KY347_01015, partial [Candidatus Woesearchaeota archaeon]|nr:hypothetical protein [Candidatus Woesearchaeota archaeon]